MITPQISVVVVAYNMRREIPRTLRSLAPDYQRGVVADDYEVIVVENVSLEPLDTELVRAAGPRVSYHYLDDPPPSPAWAINYAVSRARGRYVCLLVDGAHLLTPGVLKFALCAFKAFAAPLVMTPAFFLGPGEQNLTVFQGYDSAAEDTLLKHVGWPEDGYRLFEIGVPFRLVVDGRKPPLFWFTKLFESNCLLLPRESFQRVGGCNEAFDIPGGGFMLPDLCRQVADLAETELVQLLGEGSFHQVHGGTTTNIALEDKLAKARQYKDQYQRLRGREYQVSPKPLQFIGHMPNHACRRLMHQ
jgi:glycosyltransferase involved in cell wall biosynthesis